MYNKFPSSDGSPSAPHSRSRNKTSKATVICIALAILIVLITGAAITALHGRSERARYNQLLLTHIEDFANGMGVTEETAHTQQSFGPGLQSQSKLLHLLTWGALRTLENSSGGRERAEPIKDKLVPYEKATQVEFALIKSGEPEKAEEFAAVHVDSQLDALKQEISKQSKAADLIGDKASLLTDIVTVALLMFAATAFTLILRQMEKFHRLRESRERELLTRSEQRFHSLVYNASDVIAIISPEAEIGYLSSATLRLWGYDTHELARTSFLMLVHPDDAAQAKSLLLQVQSAPRNSVKAELRLRRSTGDWRSTEVILTNLLDEPGVEGIVLNCRDITERKLFEQQLAHQAFHDALTGLPNRALFAE